jgi:hypothetical protein
MERESFMMTLLELVTSREMVYGRDVGISSRSAVK